MRGKNDLSEGRGVGYFTKNVHAPFEHWFSNHTLNAESEVKFYD